MKIWGRLAKAFIYNRKEKKINISNILENAPRHTNKHKKNGLSPQNVDSSNTSDIGQNVK